MKAIQNTTPRRMAKSRAFSDGIIATLRPSFVIYEHCNVIRRSYIVFAGKLFSLFHTPDWESWPIVDRAKECTSC